MSARAETTRCLAALASLGLAGLAACGADRGRPPVVVLVSVDTLRADRLGTYGSDRELTPRLDALAGEAVVFEAAYAPASFTLPSVSTMLTGRYPEENAIFTNEHVLADSVPTLATALADAGCATGAVVSNWVLSRDRGLDRGFDHYDDRLEGAAAGGLPERGARPTTDAALAMLDLLSEEDEGLFLWVHYQDPHGPYTPPPDLAERYLERERARPGGDRHLAFAPDHRGLGGIPTYQRIGDETQAAFYLARYDAEVHHTDREIGRLLDGLAERGLSERAVVVVVADHGEGLGEDDYWFAHGEYLSEPLVRVPLLVRAAHLEPARFDEPVSLVDLAPTLAVLTGADLAGASGGDVFGPRRREPPYLATLGAATRARHALVDRGYKITVELDASGRVEHTALVRTTDESTDLAEREPAWLQDLAAPLLDVRRRMRRASQEAEPQMIERTPEALDALRRLGYAGGE